MSVQHLKDLCLNETGVLWQLLQLVDGPTAEVQLVSACNYAVRQH